MVRVAALVVLETANGARGKLPPDYREGQCCCVPPRNQGAKRSGVATVGNEVSFIEQISGARTGTLPDSERAVIVGRRLPSFQKGAAGRLNLISRFDKRREPPLVSEPLIPFRCRQSPIRAGCERRLSIE
jgi:hypothetical protein